MLTDNTGKVKGAINNALARALEIIGGKMETYAKQEVTSGVYATPESWYVRTGALRNSITHAVDEREKAVTVGSNIQYAPYVELGTGKEYNPPPEWMEAHGERGRGLDRWYFQDKITGEWHVGVPQKPRPFLRPALEKHREEYKNIIENELHKG